MSPRRVAVQCRKELAEFRRDPLSVGLAFALPFAMLLIFGFAIRLQIHHVPVGIQDFDRTPFSREFVSRIDATQELRVVVEPLDRTPEELLQRGDVQAAIVIPPGTARALAAGRTAPIQGLVDASNVVTAMTIKQALLATAVFAGAASAPQIAPPTIRLEERIWFNPGGNEALYVVPGVFGVVLALFPSLLAAMVMVRDKERGTIVQAYASRLRASELIAGKCLALEIIGLAEAAAIIIPACAIWHLSPVGDPTPLLVSTPLLVCCQVLFGLLVGAVTSSITSAIQIAGSVNSLLSITLSGYLYPISAMPAAFHWIVRAVPNYYYVAVSRDAFVRGGGWPSVWGAPVALALIAALLATATWLRLRRMQLQG
jgi:ABC-2 type transport system permease protein